MKTKVASLVVLALANTGFSIENRNVVLLISDNQNQADCGCYGNDVIKTPNIDRLAGEGIRFLDSFATTASCGPSRAVIYTGLQTHRNGQYGHGHGTHTYRLNPQIDTVFKLLRLVRHQLPLAGQPPSMSSRQASIDEHTGYQSIFNGENLEGWILKRADRGGYVVEDGCIVCPVDGGGYLFTERQYADFSFRFDFRLTEGANNGIAFRSPLVDLKPEP